jgi:hypothetical protein
MPRLISDSKYKKLLEDQKKLEHLQKNPNITLVANKQLEDLSKRLEILETALIGLARVLNPSVKSVEDALRAAEKFGKPRTQGMGGE